MYGSTVFFSKGNTVITTYTYDTQNRMTGSTCKVNNIVSETRVYTYDNNGNELTETKTPYVGGVAQTSQVVLTNTFDKLNQLAASVTFDGTNVVNMYNGDGLRVAKTVNGQVTRYLYDYDKVVLEFDGSGNQTARNVYGINLLMRNVGDEQYFYMYNGHADVTALLGTDGTIQGTYYYDAFGNIIETTGTVNNNITYAGYQYDKDTGFYYLNARMYDPKIARFLQEDDISYTDTNDPLTLNLYTYCHNNPITYDDPTGHWVHILAGGFIGGVVSAAIDIGSQMLFEGKSINEVDWKSVGESTVEGFITGAVGMATGGVSLMASGGKAIAKTVIKTAFAEGIVNASANAAAQYAVKGEVDWGRVAQTGGISTITGGLGASLPATKIGKVLSELGDNSKGKLDNFATKMDDFFSPSLATPGGSTFRQTELSFADNLFAKETIPVKNDIQKNYLKVVGNRGAGASEVNVVNKAWKEKIVMPDSPHTNGTPGHWFAMKRKAVELAKMDDVEKIYLNKGLSNEIPGATPNRRPDILVKRTNGLIDQFEVPSKTDVRADLIRRMMENKNILGDKAGDADILDIR